MAGHSHWSKIKHKKGSADLQRSKIFSKVVRLITVAAREGGDPEKNPKLRMAIEKAKEVNMPWENIERAIKRGTGEIEGMKMEEVLIEAFGPANVGIIIEGITDNKNRTLSEIKQILESHQGKLANEGSVRWLFERKGVIEIEIEKQEERWKNREGIELAVIEAGAEDIKWENNTLEVYTPADNLSAVKEEIKKQGIKIKSASLDWVPKNPRTDISERDKEVLEKLFNSLEENDAVQEIYSTAEL